MKRKMTLLLALLWLLAAALGEEVREGMTLNVEGRQLTLNFDSSVEYSTVSDGRALASFYVYVTDTDLYELTMNFPADVKSGDVVDIQTALNGSPESSVAAIFSNRNEAVYYYAGVVDGAVYPAGASFEIRFDDVTDVEGGRMYTGHLTARMSGVDMYSGPDASSRVLDIDAAPFSFTMPAANDIGSTPPDSNYNPFDTDPPAGEGLSPTPAPTPQREEIRV